MRYESLSIPRSACANIFPKMQIMAEQLRTAIGLKTGVVENMDESDRNNFLFHVIAKGPEIYNASLNDPDFCLYLTNNWQPLYSFMQRKLN